MGSPSSDADTVRAWLANGQVRGPAAHARATGVVIDSWTAYLDALHKLAEMDAYSALMLAHLAVRDLEGMVLPDLVKFAKQDGASWQDIGDAIDLTRQAAWTKWHAAIAGDAESASA